MRRDLSKALPWIVTALFGASMCARDVNRPARADNPTSSCEDAPALCRAAQKGNPYFCGPSSVSCVAKFGSSGCSSSPDQLGTARLECPCPADQPECYPSGTCHKANYLTLTSTHIVNAPYALPITAMPTCTNQQLSVDLQNLHVDFPDIPVTDTFSWDVKGSTAIVLDDVTNETLFSADIAVAGDGTMTIPDAGLVMNAVSAKVSGTITANGELACASVIHNPDQPAVVGDGADAGSTDSGAADSSAADSSVADSGADSEPTCTTLAVTACSPPSGPLGTAVTLTGSGFSCLRPGSFAFQTSFDGYTYLPADFHVVSDTELQTSIPTHGDGETTFATGGNCKGEFVASSTVVTIAPLNAVVYTITGTASCP